MAYAYFSQSLSFIITGESRWAMYYLWSLQHNEFHKGGLDVCLPWLFNPSIKYKSGNYQIYVGFMLLCIITEDEKLVNLKNNLFTDSMVIKTDRKH